VGYFDTARDRARYATYEWRLLRQMRRNRMPENPNPAQPPHEPVLQHVDPPDLYELPEEHSDHYVTDDNGVAWHMPVTAGAADEPVDGFGNAVRGHEQHPDPEDDEVCGYRDGGEWHACGIGCDHIRAEQEEAQEGRHFAHVGDLLDNPGDEPAYPLGVDPAVAESEHDAHADDPVSEPVEYNDTDDAFIGADPDPTEFKPSDALFRVNDAGVAEHKHDGGDWHSHETDEAPHGEG
jgi:hypothetical protein